MQNLSNENKFYLKEKNEYFLNKDFVLTLILKRRLTATRKWPTDVSIINFRGNLNWFLAPTAVFILAK